MKKTILSLMAIMGMAANASAQEAWKMVVTHHDGTKQEIAVEKISEITYELTGGEKPQLEEKNVDQLIIKELYNGGCLTDNGTSYFQQDGGVVLYNNGAEELVVRNLCFGIGDPFNAQAPFADWRQDGKLIYEDEDVEYIPAIHGIWYFPEALTIPGYSQVVVSIHGGVDHTITYKNSVNYANPDYYVMYDPESGYNNSRYYPTPSDVIPTSHYLKAVEYGMGNGWTLSVTSPALFIFHMDNDPGEYAMNPENIIYAPGQDASPVNANLRVYKDWIIDGFEEFSNDYLQSSQKRLPASIDAGYVGFTFRQGHSVYRNVDKEATLAIPGNAEKLVYGYSMGVTDGDPSGIDAEASIKNGAKIVYLDDNNSSTDFHERQAFSVRGK